MPLSVPLPVPATWTSGSDRPTGTLGKWATFRRCRSSPDWSPTSPRFACGWPMFRTHSATVWHVCAELCGLTAIALFNVGDAVGAGCYWRTAVRAADQSADPDIQPLV